jgi:poly-gamma-glutamate synthesis protein (capsule biosynthesis protein)
MQHGRAAFLETVSLLKAHGISPIGVNSEDCRKAIPTIISVKGIRLGLLGYSLRPRQHSPEPPLYTEGEPKTMLADIKALAGQVDLVVVSVHWGEEFVPHPSPGEILLARQMVEAGAAIILGHHPHVLRGIERYRDAIICYSLGNFVFDMVWDERTNNTCIVDISCDKHSILSNEVISVRINNEFQPELARDSQAAHIRSQLQRLSEELPRDAASLKMARYEADSRRELRRHQWSRRRFFLTHLLKYDGEIMRQQLTGWLRGRLCTH